LLEGQILADNVDDPPPLDVFVSPEESSDDPPPPPLPPPPQEITKILRINTIRKKRFNFIYLT